MRKWLVVLFLILVVGFGYWTWTLADLPEDNEHISIGDVHGQVEVKHASQNDWLVLHDGDTLAASDRVRTSVDSSASINWFDKGQTRLNQNTEVEINNASQAELGDKSQIEITLDHGRVWSRVLRLFDLDSDMTVKTNDVIATVRGTAFDLEKASSTAETTVWVADSVVDVKDAHLPTGLDSGLWSVPEGQMIKLGGKQKTVAPSDIEEKGKNGEWMQSNLAADDRLLKRLRQKLDNSLRVERFSGDGLRNTLVNISQRLHERLAGPRRPQLQARAVLRELAWMRARVDEGKEGAALQQFTSLEQRLTQLAKQEDQKPLLRLALKRGSVLFEDLDADSPAFRIRQRLEDVILTLSDSSDDRAYDQITFVAARLNESHEWLEKKDLERATTALDAAANAYTNLEREQKTLVNPPKKLIRYREAQRVRLTNLQARLKREVTEPVVVPTAPPVEPTTTTTPATPEEATPTAVLLNCQSIQLQAAAVDLQVGSSTKLSVTAFLQDQSSIDATVSTTFKNITPKMGTLRRNVFVATAPGDAILEARLPCVDGDKVAKMSLHIEPKLEPVTAPTSTTSTPNEPPRTTSTDPIPNLTHIEFR